MAPLSFNTEAASPNVPQVSAMSLRKVEDAASGYSISEPTGYETNSTRTQALPDTSPTKTMREISLAFFRSLWIIAKSRFKRSAIEVTLSRAIHVNCLSEMERCVVPTSWHRPRLATQ